MTGVVLLSLLALLTLLAAAFELRGALRRRQPLCPICLEGRMRRLAPGKRQCDLCHRHFRRIHDVDRRLSYLGG